MQERARYYCVVFLNQLALSHKEAHGGSALAKKLIDLYFTLFKMLVEGNIGRAAEVKKVQAGLCHTADYHLPLQMLPAPPSLQKQILEAII